MLRPRPISALLLLVLIAGCSPKSGGGRQIEPPIAVPDGASTIAVRPGSGIPFAVWSSRALPRAALRAATETPGILAAGSVRTGMVDLREARGATRPLPRRPGHLLGMAVAAVDPLPLAHGRDTARLARTLASGQAVLTTSSAALRGMDVGDEAVIASAGRRLRLEVGMLLPDNDLFDQEMLLPAARARVLSLGAPRGVVVAATPSAISAVTEALLRSLGGSPGRVLAFGALADPPTTLPIAEAKRLFGEFTFRRNSAGRLVPDPAWVRRSIVRRRVPVLGVVRCHRLIIPQLSWAMAELQALRLDGLIDSFDGCYVPRTQRENPQAISRHSFGIAFDINASRNRLGQTPTLDPRVVETLERWGFTWGGRWMVPDGMHFEFRRFVRAAR